MQLVGAEPLLQVTDQVLSPCICPYDSVIKRLTRLAVPQHGCFALVCDADRFDAGDDVALMLKVCHSGIDALLDRGDELKRVMLMPATLRSVMHLHYL